MIISGSKAATGVTLEYWNLLGNGLDSFTDSTSLDLLLRDRRRASLRNELPFLIMVFFEVFEILAIFIGFDILFIIV
jgi:hypothetical protein